jgi:hypothetical protein
MAYVAWKGSKSYASDHDSGASAVGDIFGICWTRKKNTTGLSFSERLWIHMDSYGFFIKRVPICLFTFNMFFSFSPDKIWTEGHWPFAQA